MSNELRMLMLLLVDGEDAPKNIRTMSPKELNIYINQDVKTLLQKACRKTVLLNDELWKIAYSFLFDSKDVCSLDKIWHKAAHIVTTCPDHPSGQGELNFVGVPLAEWEEYRTYFYHVMPFVMILVYSICKEIFYNIIRLKHSVGFLEYGFIAHKFSLLTSQKKTNKTLLLDPLYDAFLLLDTLKYSCPYCSEVLSLSKLLEEASNKKYFIQCPACDVRIRYEEILDEIIYAVCEAKEAE